MFALAGRRVSPTAQKAWTDFAGAHGGAVAVAHKILLREVRPRALKFGIAPADALRVVHAPPDVVRVDPLAPGA